MTIGELTPNDIGRWVKYTGGAGEVEQGRIKDWNDRYIFVVYRCAGDFDRYQDFTAQATDPDALVFIDSGDREPGIG